MGEYLSIIADAVRNLDSALLGVLAVIATASLAFVIFRSVRWMWRAFSPYPQKTLWLFTPGGGEEAGVTILERVALKLDLHNGDDVDILGTNGSPVRLSGTINHQRRASKDNVDENRIRLTEDLFEKLAGQLNVPVSSEYIRADVKFGSRGYFWNHPDRSKRYSNRVMVWVTAWTTLLTTIIAVVIEFAMP